MSGIVVYGKQGSGKTTHARRLAELYGKAVILDDDAYLWRPGDPVPDNALVLTSFEDVPGAVPLEEALRALGDRE